MKLKALRMKNFHKFTDFELEFNDKITHLVGVCGSGKTTVGLIAIWAAIKGIAERTKNGQLLGERFRFIGNNGKSADIEIELFDEKKQLTVRIKNHITPASNQISFESEGGDINQQWIDDFFNISFLSAKHFSELSSKDQALALGIDTDKFDSAIKRIKDEYTLINRDLSKIGLIEEIEKVNPVDVSELMKDRKDREEFNEQQRTLQNDIEKQEDHIANIEIDMKNTVTTIEEFEEKIKNLENEVKEYRKKRDIERSNLKLMAQPEKLKPFDDIDEKIKQSFEINKKAAAYEQYLKNVKKAEDIKKKLVENKQLQDKKQAERTTYIKAKKLPFGDLSIDDKGQLMLKGRPIKPPYYSKGQLELIVAKLYVTVFGDKKRNTLETRFIDDFELLDDDIQKKLLDALGEKNFQIVTAEVRNRNRENCVLLRECKIVKDVEDKSKIFNDE